MDPIEALERVAYLSDRGLLSPRKSEAFGRAAQVLRALPPGELQARIENGTLTKLPGIGPSTAEVAMQAAAGLIPDRVAKLELETAIPIGPGAGLRAALRGDCHTHSRWSDGGAPIGAMAAAARALGHQYLVMTDHSPRLTVANGLSAARLREQLDEIASLNVDLAPFRVLTGIEVDILLDGSLDQEPDLLAELDVVVASVHYKLDMERSAMTRRMVAAVRDPNVDILGHCTGRRVLGDRVRGQSAFDANAVFSACADSGTAVEINCRPERRDPPDELLALAVELGCDVAVDTDAHAPGQLEFLNYGCDRAADHGIGSDRIVNARDAEDLLTWCRAG